MPSHSLACQKVIEELALVVDETESPSRVLLAHLDHCDACQAELSHYRRLLRMLADLKSESERLPDGIIADLVGGFSVLAERRALRDLLVRRRGTYLIGLGVFVVTSSLLLAMLRSRSHHRSAGERRPKESMPSGC